MAQWCNVRPAGARVPFRVPSSEFRVTRWGKPLREPVSLAPGDGSRGCSPRRSTCSKPLTRPGTRSPEYRSVDHGFRGFHGWDLESATFYPTRVIRNAMDGPPLPGPLLRRREERECTHGQWQDVPGWLRGFGRERSADLQSAVSRVCSLQPARRPLGLGRWKVRASADCKSAIRQSCRCATLRYLGCGCAGVSSQAQSSPVKPNQALRM